MFTFGGVELCSWELITHSVASEIPAKIYYFGKMKSCEKFVRSLIPGAGDVLRAIEPIVDDVGAIEQESSVLVTGEIKFFGWQDCTVNFDVREPAM